MIVKKTMNKKKISSKNKFITPKWMKRLWKWADRYDISNDELPRDENKLLVIDQLDLTMVYFGMNKIAAGKWVHEERSLWPKEEIKTYIKTIVIRGKLPNELGRLTQLKKLCINYNNIEILPDSIVNLKNIDKLCLCHNKNLVLTVSQKLWIWELEKNGATVQYDEDLLYRTIDETTKLT